MNKIKTFWQWLKGCIVQPCPYEEDEITSELIAYGRHADGVPFKLYSDGRREYKMSGYIVRYERHDGTKGEVLPHEDSGKCGVEVFRTLAEADEVVQEMRDAYSYTGLKYSVTEVGKDWK